MDQKYQAEFDQPISDDEVRALIERFGEKQSAPTGRPTVIDVAETLQIEPATVASMLTEIRESKTQIEINERLDRLEKENAELRGRTQDLPDLSTPTNFMQRKIAIFMALMTVVIITTLSVIGGGGVGGILFLLMLAIMVTIIVVAVFAAKNKRR